MNRFHGIAATIMLLTAVPVRAGDPAVQCESGKLKETAKYASCRLKAHAGAVSKNLAPDFSKCDEKFAPKFEKLEEDAGPSVCPSENDAASIQARVTSDTNDLATLLGGGSVADPDRCGNGAIDGDEDCDWGTLDGETCVSLGYAGGELDCNPGSCTFDESDCITPGCGDGIVGDGEICDGNCPTCEAPPICFENTGDASTCDVTCAVPVLECRQTDDGCCPYVDAGTGCSSATDSDCAGSKWKSLEWPMRVAWGSGQCSTVQIYGINANDNFLFTTCRPDGIPTDGDPIITSVVDNNGQAYPVADDDCAEPTAIPRLAGWTCTNSGGSHRDACAPANSGGFVAASNSPVSRLSVTICGASGTPGSARLFIWYNGSSNPNPG